MDFKLVIRTFAFALPIFSAIYCIILLLVNLYSRKHDPFSKRLMFLLTGFYMIEILYCISIAMCFYYKDVYRYSIPINLYCMFVIPILLYHVVFKLTRLRKKEQFNLWHYAIPVFFLIAYILCTYIIPFYFQGSLSYSLNTTHRFGIFVHFYTKYRLYIRLLFSIIYLVLALRRVIKYKKEIIEYSADIDASSLGWLYQIFWCLALLLPAPFLYYFAPKGGLSEYTTSIITLALITIFNSILCYNIFSKNFVLLTEDMIFHEKDKINALAKSRIIDPVVFEDYMRIEKPYLRPDLKITDMIKPLGTNRTYLSTFINRHYGKNFSSFINNYRLKEIEILKMDPNYKNVKEEELIYIAGFKSLKSYQRTKGIAGKTI